MSEPESYMIYTQKSAADKAINTLKGIVSGIIADGIVNDVELEELKTWARNHVEVTRRRPFSEFMVAISSIEEADQALRLETVEDIFWLCQKVEDGGEYYDAITSEMQTLQGFFHGLLADGVLTDEEIHKLEEWLSQHEHLEGHHIYDRIYADVQMVLEDGIIEEHERQLLVKRMDEVIQVLNPDGKSKLESQIKPSGDSLIFDEVPIEVAGSTFVLTGEFDSGKKPEVKQRIIEAGGAVKSTPSKKTNFVVVGQKGNKAYAYTCYGRKVEMAINFRNANQPVSIVREAQLVQVIC